MAYRVLVRQWASRSRTVVVVSDRAGDKILRRISSPRRPIHPSSSLPLDNYPRRSLPRTQILAAKLVPKMEAFSIPGGGLGRFGNPVQGRHACLAPASRHFPSALAANVANHIGPRFPSRALPSSQLAEAAPLSSNHQPPIDVQPSFRLASFRLVPRLARSASLVPLPVLSLSSPVSVFDRQILVRPRVLIRRMRHPSPASLHHQLTDMAPGPILGCSRPVSRLRTQRRHAPMEQSLESPRGGDFSCSPPRESKSVPHAAAYSAPGLGWDNQLVYQLWLSIVTALLSRPLIVNPFIGDLARDCHSPPSDFHSSTRT